MSNLHFHSNLLFPVRYINFIIHSNKYTPFLQKTSNSKFRNLETNNMNKETIWRTTTLAYLVVLGEEIIFSICFLDKEDQIGQ